MPTVMIPAAWRNLSGGRDRVTVSGKTLRQVFSQLDVECPGLREQLVVDDDIRPGIAVAVDSDLAAEGLLQAVNEDSEILILPPIGGGARAHHRSAVTG